MRLDLRLQEAQPRLELLLLERRALQLCGVHLLAYRARVQIEDVAGDQRRSRNEPADERADDERRSVRGRRRPDRITSDGGDQAAGHRRGDSEDRVQPARVPRRVQHHERGDQHRDAHHHEYRDAHQPGEHHVAAAAEHAHMRGEHRFQGGQRAKRQYQRQRAPGEPVDQRGSALTSGGSDGHRRH